MATLTSRIYRITYNNEVKFVNASSRPAALLHVAKNILKIDRASAKELMEIGRNGSLIEESGK